MVWAVRMKRRLFRQGEFEKLMGYLNGNVHCIKILACDSFVFVFFPVSFLGDFSPECLKESEISDLDLT